MAIRNPRSWMWAEACELLDQAQRLQRQFFRFGEAFEARPRWEPPVDIVRNGDEIQITVALPGVAAEHMQVLIEGGALSVMATRPPPVGSRTTAVHRLEIPYGRFERRIALPPGRYELMEQASINGCLVIRLAVR
ncbi:MAG: heat-shock protein Hsp20 [Proteobacteria bacterium]|nr:MAG: heat-shock protein Hsp20 [Pseudomonadota bacterium]